VIWDRGRNEEQPERRVAQRDPFAALLENAPVMTLLLNEDGHVVAANRLARGFFEIEQDGLPASLVEVTLESSLLDVLDSAGSEAEAYLVHHRRTVLVTLAKEPRGVSLSFVEPYLFGQRLALGLDVYYRQQLASDYTSYGTTTLGFSPRIGLALREDLTLQLRYSLYEQNITLSSLYNNCNNNPGTRIFWSCCSGVRCYSSTRVKRQLQVPKIKTLRPK